MKVMKFGGSSVANAERIKSVIEIIAGNSAEGKPAIVLSAMKGVTDLLINSARNAEKGDIQYKKYYQEIKDKHNTAVKELLDPVKARAENMAIETMLKEIGEILHGIELVKECSARSLDLIVSFGERLSCTLAAGYMNSIGMNAEMVDCREIVITDNQFGNASVLFEKSYKKIRERIAGIKSIPVITGFIASTEEGITTTIGRNGSDYTASIIGAGIMAESIEIWTDVDGVMSSDPRIVKNAFVVPEISYQEAMELSYFGAEVIHPYTMIPAVEKNIPIWIKNTLNPSVKGTLIAKDIKRHAEFITGIACIDRVSVVNIEGGGIMKNPLVPARIFTALAEAGINIIMISQASSEHSVCLIFKEADTKVASAALDKALQQEMEQKRIQEIEIRDNLVVMAVIGENMRGTPGISGRLFNTLGTNNINVFAIAQGSSERNISFVIEHKDREKALNVLHKTFLE